LFNSVCTHRVVSEFDRGKKKTFQDKQVFQTHSIAIAIVAFTFCKFLSVHNRRNAKTLTYQLSILCLLFRKRK